MPSMPAPLRLAFLGCGFITRVHSQHSSLSGMRSSAAMRAETRRRPTTTAGAIEGAGSYSTTRRRSTILGWTPWSSPCRRASTSTSRCGRSRPASTSWSRSPAFLRMEDYRTVVEAQEQGRPRRAGRRERPLQAAGGLAAQLLAEGADRRDGVRPLHDDRQEAQDRRRLAQRRSDGRRRRVLRRRDPLAAPAGQPGPAGSPTIHGYRPSVGAEGPATRARRA